MTPEEFAAAHGLSLEEAQLILARRARSSGALPDSTERLKRALDALEAAQKKVGVHPVVVKGSEAVKLFDEETERNLYTYYAQKVEGKKIPTRTLNQQAVAVEDMSQDPEDYG